MVDMSQHSLADLREIFTRKIEYWKQQELEHEQKIDQCRREIETCEAKLCHIEALIGSPEATMSAKKTSRRGRGRRIRQSPVKLATLLALRHRAGEQLTTRQLLSAIHKDTGKRVSRQAVTLNLALLEKEKRVSKHPAPRGSGARFVYAVMPGA